MVMYNGSTSLCISLLLFLALVSLSFSVGETFQCSEYEANVLLQLKRSFGNPSRMSDWSKSTDCCKWSELSCDGDDGTPAGHVTSFTIQDSDAVGTISPSIGKLVHLKTLLIMFNRKLEGTIPSSIGNLANLQYVRIIGNPLLTGSIPTSLCKLNKLGNLNLDENQLTGSIPGCLGKNLIEFSVRNNRLTGRLPSSFMSTSTSINTPLRLFLQGNNLTGAVPASLGKLPFETIDLSTNLFTDATVLFGERKNVRSMFLHHNELAFDLSKIEFPLMLEQLYLNNNKLTGSIPEQISKLKDLIDFDVNDNGLCGPIPTGPYLDRLIRPAESFAHNKCLCGAPLEPCTVTAM